MLRFLRTTGKRTKTIWWVLIIVTVVTFLGGFVFILGSGLDSSTRARASGAIGVVDGVSISRIEYQEAIADQREGFVRQYGTDPGEQEIKMLEVQAWRSITLQRLMTRQAQALGLGATDREVVISLKTNPPPGVMSAPAFQTDGKFDVTKYQQAMMNPGNVAEVARMEEATRRQLPMRKLQERLMSSIKLSEPELNEAYTSRFERLGATVLAMPPGGEGPAPSPTDADLTRVYEQHKNLFVYGPRTQLEVLLVPKLFGEEEVRVARELAQGLVQRARAGESFASLARDYSEAPGADKGGVIDRVFQFSEFGTEMGPKIAVLDTGQVTDPLRDQGRMVVVKLVERAMTQMGTPGVKVAQIVIRIRPNDEQLREQYKSLVKLRNQAARGGLGPAATAKGLSTAMTQPFDLNGNPPELFAHPEAADWGITAKKGEVSPVFEGMDEFAVVQVAAQNPGGPASREEIAPRLRQLAELEARIERDKPKADAVAAAISQGRPLEQAAQSVGLTTNKVSGMSRLQPDPSLSNQPEVIGAMFGARPGQTIGPIRTTSGWYFARIDERFPLDPALLQQVRSQLSNDLLQRRQQSFLSQHFAQLRQKAKVKDLRSEPNF